MWGGSRFQWRLSTAFVHARTSCCSFSWVVRFVVVLCLYFGICWRMLFLDDVCFMSSRFDTPSWISCVSDQISFGGDKVSYWVMFLFIARAHNWLYIFSSCYESYIQYASMAAIANPAIASGLLGRSWKRTVFRKPRTCLLTMSRYQPVSGRLQSHPWDAGTLYFWICFIQFVGAMVHVTSPDNR